MPIDVYLKNKEEPKKISFQYDLQLQPNGPPISRVLREPRLFQNPSEDFRRKLIRGGGVGVDTPSELHADDLKSSSTIAANKSKVTESPIKKHKADLVPNDSFAELFGTPIRRVLEPKRMPELTKKLTESDLSKDKKKSSKYAPYKDERESGKEKEKHSEKEKNKEREKNKDKSLKRPQSPPASVPSILKSKDEHKKHEERRKEEHDEKKRKKEEKDKKEKTKDIKEINRQVDKEHKKEKKDLKDLDQLKKGNSNKVYDIKTNYEKLNNETVEKEKHKHRHKKKEKEKNKDKEKHRKEKDKNEKDSKEREKEKNSKKKHEEVREKEEKVRMKSRSASPVQDRIKKKPLNALLEELGSWDSASPLSEDETIPSFKSLSKPSVKIVPETKLQPVVSANPKLQSTNLNVLAESRTEKELEKTSKIVDANLIKNKKEKPSSKKNKKVDKDIDKRKGKEEHRTISPCSEREEEELDKGRLMKEERERPEKERLEEEKPKFNKDRENRKRKFNKAEEKYSKVKKTGSHESIVTPSQSARTGDLTESIEEIRRSDKFTKEYVAQLRDLQHRIMSLEDNAELQKVVKVIAETGQYEITKKTFDFDLCALDFETVKRLQEFFLPT